jgi:hypothetical protein
LTARLTGAGSSRVDPGGDCPGNSAVLLSRLRRLREVSTLATAGLEDEMAAPSTHALGYSVGWPGTSAPQDHPAIFGMVGIGVGAAYANRATGVCVAVTWNRFNPI